MCSLCDTSDHEAVQKERDRLHALADRLRLLSHSMDSLASGRMKPHGAGASGLAAAARSVIRELVEDWV